jgi:hypothetical protein
MSTFSPSLRLTLIGTGEQAGTWGNTTNTNLGTLIESAIAGSVSVTVTSVNQALTALDGAADQARNMVLDLTSSGVGANFNVYAPPVEKTYVIRNISSFTATIYNSTVIGDTTAAGAGVAIPSGKTMTVWSDGTNFRVQNNHLTNLSLSTPLAITDGGTGTTTSTGTGDLVFATSPSLTGTPTAPTASSGTNTTQLATTAFVQAALQALHPIGSIYINADVSTNPATLLGFGTWVAFGAGRVMVGLNAGDPLFDTLQEIGGSKDAVVVTHQHTGTTDSAGAHNHTYNQYNGFNFLDGGPLATPISSTSALNTSTAGAHTHPFTTDFTGQPGTNLNLQPYITVAVWRRTA